MTKGWQPAQREELQETGLFVLLSLELIPQSDSWFFVSSVKLLTASIMSEEKQLSYSEAIKEAGDSISRFPLIPVRGVPLMSYIAENWDSIWAFRPDPSDLLIATYPKAGTQTAVSRCSFAPIV